MTTFWQAIRAAWSGVPWSDSYVTGGSFVPVGQPAWSGRNYAKFSDEGYIRNSVAHFCISGISKSGARIPWKLFDSSGKEVESHPLLDLLARPAKAIPGVDVWEALYAYLLIKGDTYLEAVGPSEGKAPRELWTHRPDRINPIAGPRRYPLRYEKEINGTVDQTWKVDQVTGESAILQIKEFHPLNDWLGLSKVEPAAFGIDRNNAASSHDKALLDAGARPTGALIFKPIANTGGVAKSAPPEVIAAAEARLEERRLGGAKHAAPFVFGGDVDWKEMGMTPKDMDFKEGKLDSARDICASFGYPHILLVPGSATYNNVKEARLQLYEDTVIPMAEKFRDYLNIWLVPRFDATLRLALDYDAIPALAPRREARQKAGVELWTSGIAKRDEAREHVGLDKVGGEEGEAYIPAVLPQADSTTTPTDEKPAKTTSED